MMRKDSEDVGSGREQEKACGVHFASLIIWPQTLDALALRGVLCQLMREQCGVSRGPEW